MDLTYFYFGTVTVKFGDVRIKILSRADINKEHFQSLYWFTLDL